MGNMKYKVGDHVRIKSLDWYNANKSKSHGTVVCGNKYFDYDMREWCGKTMTILEAYQTCYIMREDGAKDLWTDEMIEGLVKAETKFGTALNPIEMKSNANCLTQERVKELSSESHNVWELPANHQFVDENGNVINATKIILEKKNPKYPKTYEECCEILNCSYNVQYDRCETAYESNLHNKLLTLRKLLICRDVYWKLAGEEMGLGKSWEPDWKKQDKKYIISVFNDTVIYFENETFNHNTILAFPSAEMRNAFYENFKKEIEICKEFL